MSASCSWFGSTVTWTPKEAKIMAPNDSGAQQDDPFSWKCLGRVVDTVDTKNPA